MNAEGFETVKRVLEAGIPWVNFTALRFEPPRLGPDEHAQYLSIAPDPTEGFIASARIYNLLGRAGLMCPDAGLPKNTDPNVPQFVPVPAHEALALKDLNYSQPAQSA